MAILSLGITSYKFIYPILGAIAYLIRSNIFSIIPNHPYSCSPLFNVFLMDIGMFLCFIFEFISLFRQSNDEKSFKRNVSDFFLKYKKYLSNTFLLLLLSILDFTGIFLNISLSKVSLQLLSLS